MKQVVCDGCGRTRSINSIIFGTISITQRNYGNEEYDICAECVTKIKALLRGKNDTTSQTN